MMDPCLSCLDSNRSMSLRRRTSNSIGVEDSILGRVKFNRALSLVSQV
jgi:hypothetical protein